MNLLNKLASIIKFWYQENFLSSRTWTDTLWVLSGNIFSKVLGLISFAILTRSLGPEMYGVFSVAISVLNLTGDLSDLGINSALVRYGAEYSSQKDIERFQKLIGIAFRSRLIIGIILSVVGILVSYYLARFIYKNDALYPFLTVAFGGVLAILLNSIFNSIFTATQQFKQLFFLNICFGFIYVTGIITLKVLGKLDAMSAFIASIVAPLIVSLIAFRMLPGGSINLTLKDNEISKRIFHFGKWMVVWSLGFIGFNQINNIMLSNIGNVAMVGYFNTAYRIVILAQIMSGAYSTVLNTKLSSMINNRQQMLHEFRMAFIYCGILIFILGIGILIAPVIISVLTGSKYASAIPIMQMLLGWMMITVILLPFSSYVYAKGETKFFALSIIIQNVFMILNNLWLIPAYGAFGAALSLLISQIPANLITMVPVIKGFRKLPKESIQHTPK